MKPSDFIPFVESLENNDLDLSDTRTLHAVLGISGEAGELTDLVKKSVVYHQPLDLQKLKEELGDLFHYTAMLLSSQGWSFEEVFDDNVTKLQTRYPNGFNCQDAVLRRDKLNLSDRTKPVPGGY